MTNAEAIGILELVVETAKGRCFVTDEAISDAYDMAISALEAQEWMPCSKRSPDEIDKYLVTLDYKEHGTGITTLWFHGLLGWDFPVADMVTAWMPLPQPYKAESEEV